MKIVSTRIAAKPIRKTAVMSTGWSVPMFPTTRNGEVKLRPNSLNALMNSEVLNRTATAAHITKTCGTLR